MSVSAPTDRAKSSVSSKIGGGISRKLYDSKTSRAVRSNLFHSDESGGRMSRVPLMARNCFFSGIYLARETAYFKTKMAGIKPTCRQAGPPLAILWLRSIRFLVLDVALRVVVDRLQIGRG